MAIEYREISRRIELAHSAFTKGARIVARVVSELELQGLLPSRLPRASSMLEVSESGQELLVPNLELVIASSVDRFVELGLHEKLGKTEQDYRAEFVLPEGAGQPESYKGRFDIPVVVEPRVSLAFIHKRAGIREYIDTDKVRNLVECPTDYPYIIFTHQGYRYRPYSVDRALTLFEDDEIGAPQIEVSSLYLEHPEFFLGRGLDAAGSQYEDNEVPFFDTFYGKPKVIARKIDHEDYSWGALSRGKEIIRLGT